MSAISACSTPSANHGATVQIKKDEVPFHFLEGVMMVVSVEINGMPPQKFILDTGIGTTLISKSLCEKIRCKIDGEFSGKRMSGQLVKIPLTSIDSIRLGQHEQMHPQVGVFDVDALLPGKEIAGFLSLGFFKDLPHTIDYAKGVIRFEKPSDLEVIARDGTVVPIQFDIQGEGVAFGVHMPLQLPSGEVASVEVDTGSQSLILHERYMKSLKISKTDVKVRKKTGNDETGHSYTRYFTKLTGPVGLPDSPIKMESPEVMFQNIIYDGLVGIFFLREFRVTYDIPRSRMIFRLPVDK